ncbi:MAG: TetR family transcriptional regulator [bacterium]
MASAGRRPGPTTTREEIREAARQLFAERGYHATTVRAIAARAGVNPALVHHHYGSKEQVFAAALALPFNPVDVLRDVIATGPRDEVADRLVRFFVRAWRSPDTGPALQSALRGAVATEEGTTTLRQFAEGVLVPFAAAALGIPAVRVAAAVSHLLGFALVSAIVGVEPLRSAPEDEVVALYVPGIRRLLQGSAEQ